METNKIFTTTKIINEISKEVDDYLIKVPVKDQSSTFIENKIIEENKIILSDLEYFKLQQIDELIKQIEALRIASILK
jgi:polyhydroxyalkanoate synthesis regulator phasin